MAVSGIFMLPVIILFFVAQKAFIEGVNLTGIKG
jgi:multiple sugar transport system permease protein